jgi:hypothetical protein
MRTIKLSRPAMTFLCTLLLLTGTALAIPETINYQGLLEEDGVPVNGSKSVAFRIYDSAEEGSLLWQETQTVTFANGVFSVLLGNTQPIPSSVFDGGQRWISVSVEGGAELLPRGEIVSVGYAYRSASSDVAAYAESADEAETAQYAVESNNANLLDGLDSSQLAGAAHTHDTRYYRQSQLNTSDGNPPNQGSNIVHWDILKGVPEGFADGVDDTGAPGTTDHGQLTGLLDNDHPQYALKDSLTISDASPPNLGRNIAHWDVLTGVPAGFADGTDNITTNASLITSGTMSPARIEGTAVVTSDSRLLTIGQKDGLTGGGITTLHRHTEIGDISSVTAGEGLSGGGTSDGVTVSHAEDASSLPFAHHVAPVIGYSERSSFESASTLPTVVDSVTVTAPGDGFLYVSFSATQKLDVDFEGPPWKWVPKRYIARYGTAVDSALTIDYYVTSSMQDTIFWDPASLVPSKPITGSTVRPVLEGQHTVYFMTEMILPVDSGADNNLEKASLTAIYFPYDSAALGTALGLQR